MPLRFLAHLRMLLGQAGSALLPPPEPVQPSMPDEVAPPASLTWASLDGAPFSPQPGPSDDEQRIASSAAASTSSAQAGPDKVRRPSRRRSEAPPKAAPPLPDSARLPPAAAAFPPELPDATTSSRSVGVGASGGDEEGLRLAAAVADIQIRRCPPLGRFGHGSSYALRVTARARPLPFAVKVK